MKAAFPSGCRGEVLLGVDGQKFGENTCRMIERIGSHSTTNLDSSAHCALPRVPSLVLGRITNSEMQKGKLVQLDGRHAVDVSGLESGTPN